MNQEPKDRRLMNEILDNRELASKMIYSPTKAAAEWEEKFEKLFPNLLVFDSEKKDLIPLRGDIKSYIAHLLKEQEAKTREEILAALPDNDDGISLDTGLPHYLEFNQGIAVGWNDALKEVRDTITNQNKQ